MKNAFIIVLTALLTACASGPSASGDTARTPQHDDPSKGIVCHEVQETGTAFAKTKCTTPEQREAERRNAEDIERRRSSMSNVR
jgi:hypothetical protein